MSRNLARWGRGHSGFGDIFDLFNEALATPTENPLIKVDVKETQDAVKLVADVPGVKKEDIAISVEDGVLKLSVTQTEEKCEEGERFYRRERRTGSASRSFTITDEIDVDSIDASLTDGVLTLTMNKAPGVAPRRIEVK